MIRTMKRLALLVLALLLCTCALAEGEISTTVVMRVSRMTQSAAYPNAWLRILRSVSPLLQ